jgi:endonuclease YncB( thermonuclease family)
MFPLIRLLSGSRGTGLLPAAATFVLGIGLGAGLGTGIGPVAASRGAADLAHLPAAPIAGVPSAARLAHPVEVLRIYDGDTFEARVHPWPGLAITTRVRLRGIDAPELKARCDEERARAEAARQELSRILAEGDVGIARIALDKYGGRVLADASTRATVDVAAALLEAGSVRRYAGGRRTSWC